MLIVIFVQYYLFTKLKLTECYLQAIITTRFRLRDVFLGLNLYLAMLSPIFSLTTVMSFLEHIITLSLKVRFVTIILLD